MKATFDYIDEVIEKAVETRKATAAPSDNEKSEAKVKARKLVAGFRVHDAEEEKRQLDAMVAKRMATIETFLKDRAQVRTDLAKLGIAPLAVVPTKAWTRICRTTGLYTFAPDAQNKVGYSRDGLSTLSDKQKKSIDYLAEKDKKWFLDLLFPDRQSMQGRGFYSATLVLPPPPEDVVEILLKARSRVLKVAAEADAISFLEKPSEILRHAQYSEKDLWARAQGYEDYKDWVKRDPIIFTECGTATAVIAQFGEFPIERAVVDAVVASDHLLPEGVSPEVAVVTNPLDDYTYRMIQQQYEAMRNFPLRPVEGPGYTVGVGTSTTTTVPLTLGGLSNQTTSSAGMITNSRLWTGLE